MAHYEKPDRWVIVELDGGNYKVFASNKDSWRMNSGIASVVESDTGYDFFGHSGSLYHCRKGCYGTTLYGAQRLGFILESIKEEGFGYMKLLEDQDWSEFFKDKL
jgi:hypothetical protein